MYFRGIITKKPDNGDTVYNEGYGHIERDTCCKRWYETKHSRDWFEIDVILVVELSLKVRYCVEKDAFQFIPLPKESMIRKYPTSGER